jgi:uncharacterized protein
VNSTWLLSLGGGALIGVAASLLLVFSRQSAGISGIFAGAINPETSKADRSWRVMFVAGLILGGTVLLFASPTVFGASIRSMPLLLVAGALVGVGTRLSGGCTSGHGVCGLSQLSGRSLVATLTFIASGIITVLLMGTGVSP